MRRMEKRLEKVKRILKEQGLDALLISKAENRHYVSGFRGSAGMLLITEEKALLITDFRYLEQGKLQAPCFTIVDFAGSIFAKIEELLSELKIGKLGFEASNISYHQYQELVEQRPGIKLIPLENSLEKLRMVKSPEELNLIRKAAEIADTAFSKVLEYIKVGVTEQDVALELEYQMKKSGAEKVSFDSIVASGPRSSIPHAAPTNRVLAAGDFLKMDFGAIYEGYCSDMTRTVVLGEPTDKQKEVYQTVLSAQLAALEGLRPGKTGREVDTVAREIIIAKGYGQYFGHGLGHSLGLAIHESPRLSQHDDTVLEPGMVLTVEPGIYLPGWGGVRIEDLVVVTSTGIENLTKSPKELINLS